MRMIVLAGCALIAGGASIPQQAAAATYHPWCLHNNVNGQVSCSFDSRLQCNESAMNTGICVENPAPAPPPGSEAAEIATPTQPTATATAPGGEKLGADPDPRIRSYLLREGVGSGRDGALPD